MAHKNPESKLPKVAPKATVVAEKPSVVVVPPETTKKHDPSCASCSAFRYMALVGEQHVGRGMCQAHPVSVPKATSDWCREYTFEKNPEPEIAEDARA